MVEIKKLAIMDVDKTLSAGYYIFKLAKYLRANNHFKVGYVRKMENSFGRYDEGKLTYGRFADEWVKTFGKGIEGEKEEDIVDLGKSFIGTQYHGKFRFTDDLVLLLNDSGFFTLAVSNSPDIIIKPFSDDARIREAIATVYVTENGFYTGEVERTYVEQNHNKMHAVKEFIENNGLDESILGVSAGFGDSRHDVFLFHVGHPFLIDPNDEVKKFMERYEFEIETCDASNVISKVRKRLK